MLRGSLENHIVFLNEWKNSAPNREEVPAVYDRIIQCFQTGLHRLEDKDTLLTKMIRVVPDNGFESLSAADMMRTDLERAVDRYLSKKLSIRGMDESGKIKGKNDYEKQRIEYVKKLKAIVKQYEACKRGPVKKEEIAEKDTLITRREQNKKNHGPGMH